MIGIMVYFSCIDTKTDLGSFERIIRFNDIWGTHRGFMWIRSIWIFGDASFIEKLFGVGPDMFYSAFSPYFDDLSKYGDSSTNAAHNEYLTTLSQSELRDFSPILPLCAVRLRTQLSMQRKIRC